MGSMYDNEGLDWMKTITILIPAYNEEAVIDKMYKKLDAVCRELSQYSF